MRNRPMKKNLKKLKLKRETVRSLSPLKLENVDGGDHPPNDPPTCVVSICICAAVSDSCYPCA